MYKLSFAISLFFYWGNILYAQCTFSISPQSPCPGQSVTFTLQNQTAGATYTWDLDGDNQADDGTGTSVTFSYPFSTSPVNYTVRVYENGNLACGSPKTIGVKAAPDPSIGVTTGQPLNGTVISACNTGQSDTLGIYNASTTFSSNTGYTINWGDGSPVLNLTNANFNLNTSILHGYSGLGYQTITVTANHQNGCSYTKTYQFFIGSNPSVGLGTPGNSVGLCAPATLMFPVTGIANNPPGTTYTFFENSEQIAQFTQADIPAIFTHIFDETSCGETTPDGQYTNAFAIKVVAQNPCGSSAATVQPITLSTKPVPDFSIQGPANYCPDAIFTFKNTSTNIHEYNTVTGQCADTLSAKWVITPGVLGTDYQITSGSLFNSNQIKVKFLKPGNYTITMTLTPTPVCGPAIISKTVTILEPPSALAVTSFSNPNGCAPQTVTFKNNSTGYQVNYTWTVSPASGWAFAPGFDQQSFEPVIIFSAPGTYTVTLTAQNVCDTDTWTTTIIVKDKPTITLPNLGPFCQTATLNFSAQNTQFNSNNGTISTYSWSFPGGAPPSSTSQFPTNIQYNVASETVFNISVSATNECGAGSATTQFTIQVPPAITMPANLTICINAPAIQLNAIPTGGSWTGSGVSSSGLFNPSLAGGTGIKTLIYNYGVGVCQAQKTMQITVAPLPVVNAGGDLSTCINQQDLALSGTPPGGNWASSGNGVVTGVVFHPAQSGSGSFTLTYMVMDANGCNNTDALSVTVHPLPQIAANDTTYCNTPGLVTLPQALPAGGTWNGPGISGNQFNPVGAGGIGTYQATYTYENPVTKCENSKTITITVTNPVNITAGPDITVCIDALPINLNTGASPSSGTWSTTSAGLSGNIFNPALAGPGTHTLMFQFGAGSCYVQDSRSVFINPLPVVNAGTDTEVCVDQVSLTLTGTPPNGTWASTGSGVVSGSTFYPSQSGAGNYTLTYTFTDNNSCTKSDALNVKVNALPVIVVNDTTYCNTPGLVALPFTAPAGGSWSGPGITGNQFDPIAAGGINTYQATYSYQNPITQCSNSKTIIIEVINPATVYAGADSAFCVSVTAVNLGFDATPVNAGTWTSTANGLQGNIFNPNMAGPGNWVFTYSVGLGNCKVTDTKEIDVWPLPSVNAGSDVSICVSEAAIALSPLPANGVWTPPSGSLNGNIFDPGTSGAGAFNFAYTFIDGNGCVNSDNLTITVHPLPAINVSDTTFCNTPGLVLLPLATPAGGIWKGPGVSGNQFDPIGAGGVGDYNLIYTYTDVNTCVDSVPVVIHVIDPPVVLAGLDDTICINTGLLALAGFSPVTGGIWSGPGIINAQTGIFDPLVAGGGIHTLTFSFGVGNCLIKDTKTIQVISANIEAGLDRTSCLDDPPFMLSGFTPAAGAWSGPGITNPSGEVDPQSASVGVHHLYYQYIDPVLGCSFLDSLQFTVHQMPESDFAQPTEACLNQEIQFDNLSQSTFKVFWTFGDGTSSTQPEPLHTYTDTGTYTITLRTENEFGCIDSISKTIFVTEPPTAFFTVAPDSGCAVLHVAFFNQSFGYQTNYNWNFGNGQTSNQYNPGFISFEQGTKDTIYYITVTAQNLCAVRTWTDSVKVFPLPITRFGVSLDTICSGEFIAFTNITLGNPETFFWDFGNGMTSTDSFPSDVQYFTDSLYRTYTIRLIANNFCGSDTTTYDVVVKPIAVHAFFNIPNAIGCQPYSVQFTNFSTPGADVSWDFGDGNTAFGPNPLHTFIDTGVFKVIQRVTSGCGYDSTFTYVTVLPAPDVSFTCTPQICRGDTLQFTNTSADLAGTIWSFGDGDTSLLYNPVHAWQNAGTFTVVLTGISAENGCPASFSVPVNVLELPKIAFMPDKLDGCTPLTVQFTNQSQGADYFEWDFGDGNTKTGTNVSHTFTIDSQYIVTLTGVDLNGCRNDTVLSYITVYPIPTPAFTLSRDQLCGVPVIATFTNQTPDAIDFFWDFGNNTTSVQNNPQVTYLLDGDYTISLVATNTFGCNATATQPFTAYSIPTADFSWMPEEGCSPLEVTFKNLSSYSTINEWFFTDGGISDLASPVYTFMQPGTYGATLIISNKNVCFDTLSFNDIILVKPSPTANFAFSETLTTPPSGMFTFTDLSIDAVEWFWNFGDGDTSSSQNPTHRYFSNGPKTVTLLVTSENKCTDDTSRTITPAIISGLFIPNAFTPGFGNGEASVFLAKGVGLREFEIVVYSSYGQLLWSSDKLVEGQPAEAWDGTYKGQPLPQDVYTWQVKKAIFENGTSWEGNFDAESGKGKKVGSVTLIR